MVDAGEPQFAFDESRRLTGPNRYFPGTAVVLTPLDGGMGHEAWARRVRAVCSALGWPDPMPIEHRHASGSFLAFAAPEDVLFTATEVNEWAWEQSCEGVERAHAFHGDAALHFAGRAEKERSRPLQRLKEAAASRALPVQGDDDALTLGAGAGGVTYPRAALPLSMDVPWHRLHDIPKALVTGSNGKTTTVRLIAEMARAAGHTPGLCSTAGVFVDGEPVQQGDWSGPAGARAVLRDARTTLAVLETARGGIARRGLAVVQADVAVVTNISADHFGEHGVDTESDLAELKLVVAHAVTESGTLVLNADDAVLMSAARRVPHAARARKALFAADHDAPRLAALREGGGSTCGVRSGRLVLAHATEECDLGAVDEMPLSFGGSASYNVMNLAAAALAAVTGLHLPVDAVRRTLQTFGRDPRDNPGRLERWSWRGATVLLDYAHNPDGLTQLLAVARAMPHRRLLLLLGQAGNRDDDAITALARAAAQARPHYVALKELASMLRGRQPGEVPILLRQSLNAAGFPSSRMRFAGDELNAARALLDQAEAEDLIVLPMHEDASRDEIRIQLQNAR